MSTFNISFNPDFMNLVQENNSFDELIQEKVRMVSSIDTIKNVKFSPVLGYGDTLGQIFGLLRFLASSQQHKFMLCEELGLPVALVNMFADAFGNTMFKSKQGQIINEKLMNGNDVVQCVLCCLHLWNLNAPENLFARFTPEAIERQYQSARDKVAKELENSDEQSSDSESIDVLA